MAGSKLPAAACIAFWLVAEVAVANLFGLMGVDCAFEAGMSGGPVLERQIDGSWLLVGLIQQSTGGTDQLLPSYTMAYRNQVVAVTAFRSALDRVLRSEARRTLAERAQ